MVLIVLNGTNIIINLPIGTNTDVFFNFVKKKEMPRVKLFDKDEAIRKAMELFWEKGYEATSLNDLTERLGIGKGSFYATFNSKRELFNTCFDVYRSANVPQIEGLLSSEQNIKVGLRKLLEFNLEFVLSDPKHRGCFLANSCSEIYSENEKLHEKLVKHYDYIKQLLINYLKQGGLTSQKSKNVSAMVLTFLIGMSQQSKINRDRINYLGSINHLVGMLD